MSDLNIIQIIGISSRYTWTDLFSWVGCGDAHSFPIFILECTLAGKGDTLSTMLILIWVGLVTMEDYSLGSWLVFMKIMGIVLFIYLTSPTSTHVLMKAAFEDNHMPLDEKDLKKAKGKESDGTGTF